MRALERAAFRAHPCAYFEVQHTYRTEVVNVDLLILLGALWLVYKVVVR